MVPLAGFPLEQPMQASFSPPGDAAAGCPLLLLLQSVQAAKPPLLNTVNADAD
jgi:hypothetical protein